MKQLTLFPSTFLLVLGLALSPGAASAQEADTLSISGTFHMHSLQGTVGADLAAVFANRNIHGWTLTLYGVTHSPDYSYVEWLDEWGNIGYYDGYVTNVYATSFDFQFIGPDANVLNAVVSAQLVGPSPTYRPIFTLINGYYDYYDPAADAWRSGPYARWGLALLPFDPAAGVAFYAGEWRPTHFSADEFGYPLVEAQRVSSYPTDIDDRRPGNDGRLESYNDVVDIGSSAPPPTIGIADASGLEGNRGTTRLNLTLTLSWSVADTVTVKYATANGTALATLDYKATSGTLTFQPGQTSRTISVAIIGDRKREPNETFTVRLSNAVGATIGDGVATVTILNDD